MQPDLKLNPNERGDWHWRSTTEELRKPHRIEVDGGTDDIGLRVIPLKLPGSASSTSRIAPESIAP